MLFRSATKGRVKVAGRGPRAVAASKAKAAAAKAPRKAAAAKAPRKKAVPTAAETPSAAHDVVDEMPAPSTSFMDMLPQAEVDIGAPPLEPFRVGDDLEEEGDDEEEEGDDEDDVTEIEEEAFAAVRRPAIRSSNYTDAEDVLLVRAWASVGLDAGTGTDQTGKRYWQRIEDAYLKMKPKNSGFISRSFRSLQGRWEMMKPAWQRIENADRKSVV